jgi:hypothetical protein
MPGWFVFLIVRGFGVCTISSVMPGAVLGIGKGRIEYAFGGKWIWFVFAAVPGFIFINIIWPYLASPSVVEHLIIRPKGAPREASILSRRLTTKRTLTSMQEIQQ